MNDIRWLGSMSVGVRQFDDDHQQVIALLREVAEAAEAGNEATAVERACRLSELAADHIRREDAFLREIGFPGVDEVIAAQRENLGKIEALARQLQADPATGADVALRMSQAFVAYLLRADINYKSFVQANGAADC